MNYPAYIHIAFPDTPETHIGPFESLADASCYMANYPADIRAICTVSDSHLVVGRVFAPDVEWLGQI